MPSIPAPINMLMNISDLSIQINIPYNILYYQTTLNIDQNMKVKVICMYYYVMYAYTTMYLQFEETGMTFLISTLKHYLCISAWH